MLRSITNLSKSKLLYQRSIRTTYSAKVYEMPTKRFVNPDELHNYNDSTATIYIKGFLNESNKKAYSGWTKSHDRIIEKNIWLKNNRAFGYYWNSGSINYIPTSILFGISLEWYRYGRFVLSRVPYLFATSVLAESVIMGYMLYKIYQKIDFDLDLYSKHLKTDIIKFSNKFGRVKLVAHSLGCPLVMNILYEIPKEYLPKEIHLCAPAFIEDDYQKELEYIGTTDTKLHIYYSDCDFILGHMFQLLKSSAPVGSHGLKKKYNNVHTHDVTHHLGVFIHNSYAHNFHRFVKN